MELVLMRHGPAGAPLVDPLAEHDRPLTASGLQRVQRMAALLEARGLRTDLVLSSPLARALQTAEALVQAGEPRPRLEILPELAIGMELDVLVSALRPWTRHRERLVAVGHEPQLSRLASLLVCGVSGAQLRLRKAGVVRMELVGELAARRCARLEEWLAPPD
jgi:phosphohistidine phosphatase